MRDEAVISAWNVGQCLTAGWALQRQFSALYGSTSPGDILLEMPQKCLREGGDERSEIVQWTISAKNARPVGGPGGRRCPAGFALDSGHERGGLKGPSGLEVDIDR